MIVIIDYGMGNLGSIQNMLTKIGAKGIISSDISDIQKADKLILPGVGAFDNGMENLHKLGIIPTLNAKILDKKTPILGICLGMQLLGEKSEEGSLMGIGWIDAEIIKFKFDNQQSNFKIPHMGWNSIQIKKESPIFKDMPKDARFYFVHSYYVECKDKNDILATTNYNYEFTSIIQKENIFGVQFHPEKSLKYGIRLFQNFVSKV